MYKDYTMKRMFLTDFSDIGDILYSLRKKKKYSRKIAGSKTGCSAKTIERLEKGEGGDIGISKIINLLDSLGYQIEIVPKGRLLTMEELQNGTRY
jgi:transcriptional regulator with XRE-family HTH domain